MLFRYETDLAHLSRLLGDDKGASMWATRAGERHRQISGLCWDEDTGWFQDVNLDTGRWPEGTPKSLASYVPLWAGLATDRQAARMVDHLSTFEAAYGLTATEPDWDSDTEHSWPTGWAYSHWFVCEGLRRYGYHQHSQRIALKWLRRVAEVHSETGEFLERYNVVDPAGPTPGRYRPQPGFAWTNAAFIALIVRVIFGLQPDGQQTGSLPEGWRGRAELYLVGYPWG
jgi:neutral trehalase